MNAVWGDLHINWEKVLLQTALLFNKLVVTTTWP